MPEIVVFAGMGVCAAGVFWHLARAYFELTKGLMDLILGCLLLVFALPVLAVCGIIIKLSSRGPVLIVQVRVGKDGKLFRMYKLRTMYADAEKRSGAVWAGKDDPRVVPSCAWMRRAHVDELPQLVNVIMGHMSLVGPRPERPEIVQQLQTHYPDIHERHAVKPGITGLAQVRNGYDTSVKGFRRKLTADLYYVRKRKWSLDLAILAMTFTKFNDKLAR